MLKLKSMKLDKKAREETQPSPSLLADQPIYPYGLQVRLDEDALAKLGLDELPKVDAVMMLIARVTVTSVSSNEHSEPGGKGKHKHRNVELQITDLCLEDEAEKKDAADTLYAVKG
jgi:hypothetical protein